MILKTDINMNLLQNTLILIHSFHNQFKAQVTQDATFGAQQKMIVGYFHA